MNQKEELLKSCQNVLESKISHMKEAIDNLQSSANENAKSAMGDKYETTRSMAQLEIENLMSRYHDLLNQRVLLNTIRTTPSLIVALGSLVKTTQGIFYLSTSLGKIDFNGSEVFAVAIDSPIGKQLSGKQVNDSFELNGRKISIKTIE